MKNSLIEQNILMLAPTPFFADRGCHIRVLNSYLKLKRQNANIVLLTYPIGRNIDDVKTIRIPKVYGYKKLAPGFSVYRPILDLILLIKTIEYVKKIKPGIIYCHLHEGALIGILVKIFFPNLKIIFDAQGSLSGELFSYKKNRSILKYIFDFIEKYIVRRVDEILTSTKELRLHFIKYGILPDIIKVEEDAPDQTLFNKDIEPISRAELNIPDGKKVIAYLGGLQPNKGIQYLLDAVEKTDKNIHFLIMGYPLEYARKKITELNIENRVTLLGPIPYENAGSYLRTADAAVSPKIVEETGEANAKLYIYKALGLPSVCFNTHENRLILGETGYYAANKDSSDLAVQIEKACGINNTEGYK